MNLTAADIAFLHEMAKKDGYSAEDALKVFEHESSNRPGVWGGTGKKYFGLWQAGPSERKDYGVDTARPSARNQIEAFGRFLHGRGFKAGMGLQDMYSTVLAGSPGHYNRSDGAGTVAQHVARMSGSSAPSPAAPPGLLQSGGALAYADTSSDRPDPIGELLAMQPPKKAKSVGIEELLATPQDPQSDQQSNEEFMRQMMDFHRAQHLRAIQGLL